MRGQQQRVFAIAATSVPPLDSPLSRGVKGTLPLAHFFPLFLWASKEIGPPEAPKQ